jgi:hypothetical protein
MRKVSQSYATVSPQRWMGKDFDEGISLRLPFAGLGKWQRGAGVWEGICFCVLSLLTVTVRINPTQLDAEQKKRQQEFKY